MGCLLAVGTTIVMTTTILRSLSMTYLVNTGVLLIASAIALMIGISAGQVITQLFEVAAIVLSK
jgi:hypothetical protein